MKVTVTRVVVDKFETNGHEYFSVDDLIKGEKIKGKSAVSVREQLKNFKKTS